MNTVAVRNIIQNSSLRIKAFRQEIHLPNTANKKLQGTQQKFVQNVLYSFLNHKNSTIKQTAIKIIQELISYRYYIKHPLENDNPYEENNKLYNIVKHINKLVIDLYKNILPNDFGDQDINYHFTRCFTAENLLKCTENRRYIKKAIPATFKRFLTSLDEEFFTVTLKALPVSIQKWFYKHTNDKNNKKLIQKHTSVIMSNFETKYIHNEHNNKYYNQFKKAVLAASKKKVIINHSEHNYILNFFSGKMSIECLLLLIKSNKPLLKIVNEFYRANQSELKPDDINLNEQKFLIKSKRLVRFHQELKTDKKIYLIGNKKIIKHFSAEFVDIKIESTREKLNKNDGHFFSKTSYQGGLSEIKQANNSEGKVILSKYIPNLKSKSQQIEAKILLRDPKKSDFDKENQIIFYIDGVGGYFYSKIKNQVIEQNALNNYSSDESVITEIKDMIDKPVVKDDQTIHEKLSKFLMDSEISADKQIKTESQEAFIKMQGILKELGMTHLVILPQPIAKHKTVLLELKKAIPTNINQINHAKYRRILQAVKLSVKAPNFLTDIKEEQFILCEKTQFNFTPLASMVNDDQMVTVNNAEDMLAIIQDIRNNVNTPNKKQIVDDLIIYNYYDESYYYYDIDKNEVKKLTPRTRFRLSTQQILQEAAQSLYIDTNSIGSIFNEELPKKLEYRRIDNDNLVYKELKWTYSNIPFGEYNKKKNDDFVTGKQRINKSNGGNGGFELDDLELIIRYHALYATILFDSNGNSDTNNLQLSFTNECNLLLSKILKFGNKIEQLGTIHQRLREMKEKLANDIDYERLRDEYRKLVKSIAEEQNILVGKIKNNQQTLLKYQFNDMYKSVAAGPIRGKCC